MAPQQGASLPRWGGKALSIPSDATQAQISLAFNAARLDFIYTEVKARKRERARKLRPWSFSRFIFETALYGRYYFKRFFKSIQRHHNKAQAWLIRQPEKLPVIGYDAPPKVITMGIIFMILCNVLFLCISLQLNQNFWMALGKRAAIAQIVNTPILALLGMDNQPLRLLPGGYYEYLDLFYARLEEQMMIFVLLHSGSHLVATIINNWSPTSFNHHDLGQETVSESTQDSLYYLWNRHFTSITGISALFGLVGIWVIGGSNFRIGRHQGFRLPSLALQCFYMMANFFHAPFAKPYIISAVSINILDRAFAYFILTMEELHAKPLVIQNERIITLFVSRPQKATTMTLAGRCKQFLEKFLAAPWSPGCHIYLTVKSLRTGGGLTRCPFYLASARDGVNEWFKQDDIHVVTHGVGFWWEDLIINSLEQPTIRHISIEGPYGTSYHLKMLQEKDVGILVTDANSMGAILPIAQGLGEWETGHYDPITNTTIPPKRDVLLILLYQSTQDCDWFMVELGRLQHARIDYVLIAPTNVDSADTAGQVQSCIQDFMRLHDSFLNRKHGVVCAGSRELQRVVRDEVADAKLLGYDCVVKTLRERL